MLSSMKPEMGLKLMRLGGAILNRSLENGELTSADEVNFLVSESINVLESLDNVLAELLALSDEAIMAFDDLPTDIDPLFEIIDVFSPLLEDEATNKPQNVLRLKAITDSAKLKREKIIARQENLETEAVLRDFPDILERIDELESGKAELTPLRQVMAELGDNG